MNLLDHLSLAFHSDHQPSVIRRSHNYYLHMLKFRTRRTLAHTSQGWFLRRPLHLPRQQHTAAQSDPLSAATLGIQGAWVKRTTLSCDLQPMNIA